MAVIYVPRAFGGTLILGSSVPVVLEYSTITFYTPTGAITFHTPTGAITFTEFGGIPMSSTDSYSPRIVGDTADALQATFNKADGTAYDLTSATNMVMIFHNLNTSVKFTGTGTWSITNAAQGQATYSFSASDVAAAGVYLLIPSMSINGQPKHFLSKVLEIDSV